MLGREKLQITKDQVTVRRASHVDDYDREP
jgi:hypothetical protein